MKQRIIIISLSVTLVISLIGNVLISRVALKYYDDSYGMIAENYLRNAKLLSLLEQPDINEATEIIKGRVKWQGEIIAICLMERCSDKAIQVMDINERP